MIARQSPFFPRRENPRRIRAVRHNPSEDPVTRYEESHWGIPATKSYTSEAPHTPDALTMMGVLREFKIRAGNSWFVLKWPLAKSGPSSILAFATSKDERLYPILNALCRRMSKQQLIVSGEPFYPIKAIAKHVGGRQAKYEDRDVDVQPIGKLHNVVYRTEKKGDGLSDYVHRMGEEGGIEPFLCVDRNGWVYVAGGSYEVKNPGISR